MAKSMKQENYFDLLNEEILFLILDHLSIEDDHLAVKSFSLSSKSFHSAESKHRGSAKLLRPEFLPCVLRRYHFLSHLDLSLCPRITDSQLQTASSLGPALRSLKLTLCRFVTGLGVSDLVSKCPNLVELDLSNATELSDSAAAAISRARNLERLLMVRCKRVSDMGIGCIAVGCKKLKRISLKWCLRVTDLGVGLLALKCKDLCSLDLSYVPITEKSLTPILQLSYLEDLVLVGCLGIDDDGLAFLDKGHTMLKTLDLSNRQNISHTGIANLTRGAGCLKEIILAYGSAVTLDVAKCLENFSMLQCLSLDGSPVTCSALRMIGNLSCSLRELSLSKCSGVTDEGIACIVRKHTQLRKLDITCCRKISVVSIDCITSSCTALTSLKMEACSRISADAFVFIGQRCRVLEELDATDNNIDDEGLKSISRCSRLSCFKLGICLGISDEGLIQVGMRCSQLKEIDLYRAIRISDEGIASIAQGCPILELINIAYCDQVTDVSLISLSKCWRLKALEARGCSLITSKGLASIAAGCGQLMVLDIKKCYKINNSGMIPLARHSLNLKQINLSYCSVTDAGLLALASRSPLQNITILHLAGLSPNGLAAALLACRGLKKAKIHESFKAMLPQSLLNHMESRGCIFHWRDKAFQPQVISLDKSLFLCLITNDRENPNH
ncbi:F-box/LRR-repeat protein 3 isoform X1 [Spinacia oleracea]|uniref:F-box/LRR-repeat protein 3 isoform X1 n=1 Tax=Spinacia oleracea TaxID=3562 RepID=A0A9R0J4R9_SPIOL|nr:F-box/LRR-repeat protein 3-like isoform X1 [Spinacia oleracea]